MRLVSPAGGVAPLTVAPSSCSQRVGSQWAGLTGLGKTAVVALAALVIVILAVGAARAADASSSPPAPPAPFGDGTCFKQYSGALDRARCVHRQVPMVDGHNDLPWAIRRAFNASVASVDLAVLQNKVRGCAHACVCDRVCLSMRAAAAWSGVVGALCLRGCLHWVRVCRRIPS